MCMGTHLCHGPSVVVKGHLVGIPAPGAELWSSGRVSATLPFFSETESLISSALTT